MTLNLEISSMQHRTLRLKILVSFSSRLIRVRWQKLMCNFPDDWNISKRFWANKSLQASAKNFVDDEEHGPYFWANDRADFRSDSDLVYDDKEDREKIYYLAFGLIKFAAKKIGALKRSEDTTSEASSTKRVKGTVEEDKDEENAGDKEIKAKKASQTATNTHAEKAKTQGDKASSKHDNSNVEMEKTKPIKEKASGTPKPAKATKSKSEAVTKPPVVEENGSETADSSDMASEAGSTDPDDTTGEKIQGKNIHKGDPFASARHHLEPRVLIPEKSEKSEKSFIQQPLKRAASALAFPKDNIYQSCEDGEQKVKKMKSTHERWNPINKTLSPLASFKQGFKFQDHEAGEGNESMTVSYSNKPMEVDYSVATNSANNSPLFEPVTVQESAAQEYQATIDGHAIAEDTETISEAEDHADETLAEKPLLSVDKSVALTRAGSPKSVLQQVGSKLDGVASLATPMQTPSIQTFGHGSRSIDEVVFSVSTDAGGNSFMLMLPGTISFAGFYGAVLLNAPNAMKARMIPAEYCRFRLPGRLDTVELNIHCNTVENVWRHLIRKLLSGLNKMGGVDEGEIDVEFG